MKLLKCILVVAALLAAVMPCCHAGHGQHAHEHDAEANLCALPDHGGHCQSCEKGPCRDKVKLPQKQASSPETVEAPATPAQHTVFFETNPPVRRIPHPVFGILASIQTIQLLI